MGRKKRNGSQKNLELYEKTCAQEQERLDREQERFILDQQKFRLKEQKEEERIMSIDTTNMPALKAQYYESLQMEIMKKRCSSSN